MWTLGLQGGSLVLFTDAGEQCAGFTKVVLPAEDAETLVRQAAFLLGLSLPMSAPPTFGFASRDAPAAAASGARVLDTLRPTATDVASAAAATMILVDPVEEALANDARQLAERRALDERKAAAERERELRRIRATRGAEDDE